MEAIRTKDKLFLAVVVPTALAVAYAYLWRADAVRHVGELEREDAALVAVEDFPLERQKVQRFLATAREELAAEENRPMPVARVKAKADDGLAAREKSILEVFHRQGLAVERSCNVENGETGTGDVLARTGLRPHPAHRQYAIVGGYPQVRAALQTFAEREMAVIPDLVEMSAPGRWTLVLWL